VGCRRAATPLFLRSATTRGSGADDVAARPRRVPDPCSTTEFTGDARPRVFPSLLPRNLSVTPGKSPTARRRDIPLHFGVLRRRLNETDRQAFNSQEA
jgi:hypothetical protein